MTLISLEVQKTFRRWRTYIGFAAVAGAVILLEIIIKLNEATMARSFAGNLNADFLVSGNILNVWTITTFVMNSLYVHVPFLIALVAGDMVSSEGASGTIRFLLIRPPSRTEIIFSKYMTMLFYSAAIIIFLAVLCIGIGYAFFGSGDVIRFQAGIPHIVISPSTSQQRELFWHSFRRFSRCLLSAHLHLCFRRSSIILSAPSSAPWR